MKNLKHSVALVGGMSSVRLLIQDKFGEFSELGSAIANIETKKSFKKRSKFDQLSQSRRDKGIG